MVKIDLRLILAIIGQSAKITDRRMTNSTKQLTKLILEILKLRFVWRLVLGIWDLYSCAIKLQIGYKFGYNSFKFHIAC
jgi:hypothetical protein